MTWRRRRRWWRKVYSKLKVYSGGVFVL